MKTKLFLLLVISFLSIGGLSQVKITGIIIDQESGHSVSDAVILKENGKGVITDSTGQFTVNINRLPVKLGVSHVSYGQSEFNIEKIPDGLLVIRIQKMISNLEEVQISAERMRILTEKDDFSLQHFAFDNDNLWMIGNINNQANKGKVFLANDYGDTISSANIKEPGELFKDVFNNVHLVMRDSVYQLFSPNKKSIHYLYPADRKKFIAVMDPIMGSFGGKIVYKSWFPNREEIQIYYYDNSSLEPHFITRISDSLERIRKESDIRMKSIWSEFKKSRYWLANTKLSKIYEGTISTPLFNLNDSLYILNKIKDSILIYDHRGRFAGAVSVNFHNQYKLGDIDPKEIVFLSDEKVDKVYTLERKTTRWIIQQLDVKAGKLLAPIQLPDFAGMYNIRVHNNAIYFLYPEKKYPYFTRLYRYQLD